MSIPFSLFMSDNFEEDAKKYFKFLSKMKLSIGILCVVIYLSMILFVFYLGYLQKTQRLNVNVGESVLSHFR